MTEKYISTLIQMTGEKHDIEIVKYGMCALVDAIRSINSNLYTIDPWKSTQNQYYTYTLFQNVGHFSSYPSYPLHLKAFSFRQDNMHAEHILLFIYLHHAGSPRDHRSDAFQSNSMVIILFFAGLQVRITLNHRR